jgi:hypothetical protein
MLAKVIDGLASAFCHHEWSRRHEPERWYLECVKCRTTTGGILVGPRHRNDPPAATPPAPRVSVLAFWKTQRAA